MFQYPFVKLQKGGKIILLSPPFLTILAGKMTYMPKKSFDLVRYDAMLIDHGSYKLSTRATKFFAYVVARYVDPKANEGLPTVIDVPLFDVIRDVYRNEGTISKSIYTEIDDICLELTSNPITFPSNVELDGHRLRGSINWCTSAIPMKDKNTGAVYIQLEFGKHMSRFLVNLKKYGLFSRLELNGLRGIYSIRFFKILRAARNMERKHRVYSRKRFSLNDLRFKFKLEKKYSKFKDFRRCVIEPAVKELNERTSVKVLDVEYVREGRKISYIDFIFTDQDLRESNRVLPLFNSYQPSQEELDELSWAKETAYFQLVEFGVDKGIAFKQILPTISGSEINGFEDIFVLEAFKYFKEKAKQVNPGTFVNWWVNNKAFSAGESAWSIIMEKIIAVRKKQERDDSKAFQNRLAARDIPKAEFIKFYREQEQEAPVEMANYQTTKEFTSIGDILKGEIVPK